MSWLREEPQAQPALSDRAGALSVACTLTLDGTDTLVLAPHPDLNELRGPVRPGHPQGRCVRYDIGLDAVDLSATVRPGVWCDIVEGERLRARMSYDPRRRCILLDRAGFSDEDLPVPDGDRRVRVLLDADILEVFTAQAYGAYRIARGADPSTTALVLSCEDAAVACLRLGRDDERRT